MRIYTVEGGTHLGIVGCFGVKSYRAKDERELHNKILINRGLPENQKCDKYGENIITMVDDKGYTIFEYRIVRMREDLKVCNEHHGAVC